MTYSGDIFIYSLFNDTIRTLQRILENFRNKLIFYGEELLAPRPSEGCACNICDRCPLSSCGSVSSAEVT
jgi:hypothetical protein